MRLGIQLYSRAGCHLCEVAEADVRRVIAELNVASGAGGAGGAGAADGAEIANVASDGRIELEVIDIDRAAHSGFLERYGERVPVLVVGGTEYAAPLPKAKIERAIRAGLEASRLSGDDRHRRSSAGGWLRHWLLVLNLALGAFLAGALAAPVLAASGFAVLSDSLYAAYHLTCHQWAFRSFFLFGAQPVYSEDQLAALGVDPFGFAGDQTLGWKMAICERDVAIYVGLLAVGLLYARGRTQRTPALVQRPLGFVGYTILILPMAIDGFTQLFGWRESTWELRVGTGLLFGVASAWLVLPRLEEALLPRRESQPTALDNAANRTAAKLDHPSATAALIDAANPASDAASDAADERTQPRASADSRYPPALSSEPPACHPPLSPAPAPRRG